MMYRLTWFSGSYLLTLVNHFIIDGDYYAVLDDDGASRYVRLKLDGYLLMVRSWTTGGKTVTTSTNRSYLTKLEFPTVNVLKAEQQAFRADTTSLLLSIG